MEIGLDLYRFFAPKYRNMEECKGSKLNGIRSTTIMIKKWDNILHSHVE